MYSNGLRWRVSGEWWELANSGCGVGETIANSNHCARSPKNALHESFQSIFWCCEWPTHGAEWPSYEREWPSYCNYSLTKFRNAMSKCRNALSKCRNLWNYSRNALHFCRNPQHFWKNPLHFWKSLYLLVSLNNPSPYLTVILHFTTLVKGFWKVFFCFVLFSLIRTFCFTEGWLRRATLSDIKFSLFFIWK